MHKHYSLTEEHKKYIRANHFKMPISQMAKRLFVAWSTVKRFMDSEGLKMLPRKKGTGKTADRGGRHSETKKIGAPPGMFNVHERETWLV